MATETVGFVILPALIVGGIIGLIEMFFVHSDEIGMGWFGHGLHALPFTILFTFINMNTGWALQFLPFNFGGPLVMAVIVRGIVAIIGMLKIAAAAAIAGRVGERFYHTLIIGALIFAVPFVWDAFGASIPLPKLPFEK
ncbi:hypothetical protein JXC34_01630 [Candidatus Woesearchaeota archaeon]|nr:hypothetical protein [Candidatus Woesearchaeota archaeon]